MNTELAALTRSSHSNQSKVVPAPLGTNLKSTNKDKDEDSDLADMAAKIRQILSIDHITQADLARRVGIAAPHLNSYLNGHSDVRSSLMIKILRELGVDLNLIVEHALQKRLNPQAHDIELQAHPLDRQLRSLSSSEQKIFSRIIEKLSPQKRKAT